MPQLDTPRVRVSRQTVRALYWAYAGGLALSVLVAILVASTGPAGARGTWSIAALVVASVGVAAAIASHRLMRGLPPADHPVFDTVGQRFDYAMRQLFLRFVLSGAAAEATGLMGAVLLVLGASFTTGLLFAGGGLVLLDRLRRRAAPLVRYLA